MGNFCSISISCDRLFSGCLDLTFRKAFYISKLKENVDRLRNAVGELEELHSDVKSEVEVEEEQQFQQQLDQVRGWITRAEAAISKSNELLRDGPQEIEKLCLGGYCSKNYKSSYRFAKKVDEGLREVDDLKAKGGFKTVAGKIPAGSGAPRPSEPTVGLESTFKKVWTCLREEKQVGIVGLYGMGGVGKTTLLTQIHNESLKKPTDFDKVIWVVVSKDLKPDTVQESIRRKIGFSDDFWKNKSFDERAMDIFNALSQKRFVMLLDDIWERVDLNKLGVPVPNKNNGSKVVFTTRSEQICGRMEAQKIVKVDCLEPKDAWDLFQRKVGDQTLCFHPDIPVLARAVARECGGLPLALITIGRAMACMKTPQEWRHAIEVLQKSAAEFSGMGDEVFPLLKFSYDNLPEQEIKTCFLYCSLFPEDFLINKTELIEYWIGEGIFDGCADTEVENRGHYVIGHLLRACLLEDKDDCVRMHDVIRDMALWIASDIERDQHKFFVQTGAQLSKAPEIGKWEGVRRVSLMANHIEHLSETPSCSNLRTLFLGSNLLSTISIGFFQSMPNLTVLDLSNNKSLLGLPADVCKLVSLQYLNLSRTGITELPTELKALVKLRYLNLEHTDSLYLLPHGVISCFQMMHILRMFRCGSSEQEAEDCILSRDESLVDELQCLKELHILTVTIRSAAALERLSSSRGTQNSTRVLHLENFQDSKLVNFSSLADMKNLDALHISQCRSLEEMQIDWERELQKMQAPNNLAHVATTERPFRSLSRVDVEDCTSLRNLNWLILAQNLTFLSVSNCPKMVEVASIEKLPEVPEVVENLNPFAKLKAVELLGLPRLESFYSQPLPSVKDVRVIDCPLLEKRPASQY